jgi:aminoglycoside phosphotransferase (APT) family kinase protein
MRVDLPLVQTLIAEQFRHWAHLPLEPVSQCGWHNRCFLLGSDMVVRLPKERADEAQLQRELAWLPYLRPRLAFDIPEPLDVGEPTPAYPCTWAIYRWLPGVTAAATPLNTVHFAADLAAFLNALRSVPACGGPRPAPENFFRGANPRVYDAQCRQAVAALAGQIDTTCALAVWDAALATEWTHPAVWVHGDIALGNLLFRDGRLTALIDFGQVSIGDPACDLAIAWTHFRAAERALLRDRLNLDRGTWLRGGAWALWKAAIVAAGLVQTNAIEGDRSRATLDEILRDAEQLRL